MSSHFKKFSKRNKHIVMDERGQGLVEYALILVLIAAVVVTAFVTIGNSVGSYFSAINF